MIRVKRPAGTMPKQLYKKGPGHEELLKNRALLAQGNDKDVDFAAYRLKPVRDQLTAVFGRKCVFCESLLLGTQSGDIEHFRPKGRVVVIDPVTKQRAVKPGYYWLAARWHNLLIACQDCNRPREQENGDGSRAVLGKASYFPLADEAGRATTAAGVRKEQALLLHPCRDDPALHLEFTDAGGIRARAVEGIPSAKGAATIEYCGLSRAELLQMRARHRRTVMAAITHIIDDLAQNKDPGQDLEDLVFMLQAKEAYTAYTRHLVRTYLAPYLEELGLAA